MRNRVVLHVRGWKGDQPASLDESVAMLTQFLEVNDHVITPKEARFVLTDGGGRFGFFVLELEGLSPEDRGLFSPEQILFESDGQVLRLPVGELVVEEWQPTWA